MRSTRVALAHTNTIPMLATTIHNAPPSVGAL